MTHYLVARININDREEYLKYSDGFMEIFSQYDGKMLSVDETPKLLEGEWTVSRTVLIAFPSEESAMAWYHSEAYQTLAQHRFASSDGDIVVLKGF